MKETDIARPVVAWLQREGWDVYQEVSAGYADSVADIVATKGSLLWVVEVKARRTLALIDQIRAWDGHANLLSVATPPVQTRTTYRLRAATTWDWICDRFGIGRFRAIFSSADCERWPRLRRDRTDFLANKLHPRQKTIAEAGGQGGYYTPFRATCEELRDAVAAEPGINIRDAVDRIRHHYSSDAGARQCLSRLVDEGVVEGVEKRKQGRVVTLWPAEAVTP